MPLVPWFIVLALFACLCGAACVKYLTCPPRYMRAWLVVTLVDLGVTLLLLLVAGREGQALLGIGLGLLGAAAGYLGMTLVELSRRDDRPLPALTRQQDDPGLGHTGVVYLAHGEPQSYDPIGWLNQFREFDEQKIPFVPLAARPFFLFGLRKKYLQVGLSQHHAIHQQMLGGLEQAFRTEGDLSTRFYLSFLDDHPRPDAAAIQALNEGASRIIVAEVLLTDSNHTAEGKELVREVMAQYPEIPVQFTSPLHDSPTLQRMYVERASRLDGASDRSKVGVLLVGHGQPDAWDREWPTETAQEISYRLAVLEQFAAQGYRTENMSLAWMEFKQPQPAPKVEEFLRNGVVKVLYIPAAISAECIHSQVDVPELVNRARVPGNFPLVSLGAWNDDPLAVQAIKEKIDLVRFNTNN